MTTATIPTREQVVAEALSWLDTPYHPTGAMVKGAGCDCGSILYAVWHACGLIPAEEIGLFSPDWFANTSEEVYMQRVLRHAYKIAEGISYATLDAAPGNIALTRHDPGSRVRFNHGGLIVKWPTVIHAVDPKVTLTKATTDRMWCYREVIIFDPWKKLEAEGKL
jgi:cell wall-associated NlpC family hydrolase